MTRDDEDVESGCRFVVLSGQKDLQHRLGLHQPPPDQVAEYRLCDRFRTGQKFPVRHLTNSELGDLCWRCRR